MRSKLWMGIAALAVSAAVPPVQAAGAPPEPGPAGAYATQTIEWEPCLQGDDLPPELPKGAAALECGSYQVPRDWSAPDAGVDLTIAVSRLRPATGGPPAAC